ncbi:adenylate/guanylate cyclase domain-containing protein [Kiloniella sp.]|uniref:adenylate/guanylate cyclase domain-containing protein n=1 Tax=Kiloniella sp. TaxID=1938587 RepID=UPI003B024B5E
MERRLAAILVADVVGYSHMIEVDEEGTLTSFKAIFEGMISPVFSQYHGRLVKLMGDGILAEFTSVVDAVQATVKIQETMAKHNSLLASNKQVTFRVGINHGDIVIDGEDIHGDVVNLAARLETLSLPGGMSISEKVYDEVRDRVDIRFCDQGIHQVKNIERPIHIWGWAPQACTSKQVTSERLQQTPPRGVSTPNTTPQPTDFGTKSDEAHDLFLRGRELLFGFQRDINVFERVIPLFRHAIALDENYSSPYAALGMAYVLNYINCWSGDPKTSLNQAKIYVREAIKRNENDAFAHYANSVVAMWKKDHESWAQAADRALELNPDFALALNSRGAVYIYSGAPLMGIPYIQRCIRLDQLETQQARHFLGTAYLILGEYETAAEVYKKRIKLNPTTDLTRAFLASVLGHMGEIEEAHTFWRELKDINPAYSFENHISKQPFKDPAEAKKITSGLRKAGLIA